MIGGLITSTLFTLLALPTFYQLVHQLQERWHRRGGRAGRGPAGLADPSPERIL
jgi:hypothetical protein